MPPKIKQILIEQEEQKIFNELLKIGFSPQYSKVNKTLLEFINVEEMSIIKIDRKGKRYIKVDNIYYQDFIPITFKEHYWLNKLFELWGWFDE